jgi:hypothetical protein
MTKKVEDHFQKFADAGALIFSIPVDGDLCQEVAEMMDGKRYDGFTILRAVAGPGAVMVAYSTADQSVIELFAGRPSMVGRFPMPLTMLVSALSSAIRSQRDQQEIRRRREAEQKRWEAASAAARQ